MSGIRYFGNDDGGGYHSRQRLTRIVTDTATKIINLASLKDSNNQTSRYIGAGIKRRFKLRANPEPLNFDLGVAGLVMKRQDYNDEKPFFGAIPFVSLSNGWGGINATYVPSIEEDTLPFWYFQFTLKLMQL